MIQKRRFRGHVAGPTLHAVATCFLYSNVYHPVSSPLPINFHCSSLLGPLPFAPIPAADIILPTLALVCSAHPRPSGRCRLMPAQPVVEIDVRHSSPYNWRAWSQADPLNGHSTSGRDSVVASRSHTPVFVSANKVASTSTSSVNQLPGYKAKPVKADHVPRPAHAKKHAGDNDVVRPPAHEPRLRSVFVDGPRSSPWLPSHRVPRVSTERQGQQVGPGLTTCVLAAWAEYRGSHLSVGLERRGLRRHSALRTGLYHHRVARKGEQRKSHGNPANLSSPSCAQHVHFVHCELARSSNLLGAGQTQLLPCAWGACRFKRYSPTRLKEHVLEHLRPLAFRCPFETCRMSANSLIGSVDDLEGVSERSQGGRA